MSNNNDSFGDDDGDTSSDDVIRDNPDLLSRRPNEFEYNSIPSSPSDVDPDHWTDVFVSSLGVDVHFSIDTATKASWEQAIGDIKEVRGRLAELVSSRLDSDGIKHNASGDVNVSFENLFDLVFGFESGEFGRVFARELGLDHKLYLKFLGTLFLQMSYKESPSQLFADDSELKSSLFIEKREYMSNAKRAFMYYSKPALIRMAAADFQIVLAQSLSIDKLVLRLADLVTVGSQSSDMSTVNQEDQEEQQMTASGRGGNLSRNELTIIQAVTKAVLQRSFMKPLKGAERFIVSECETNFTSIKFP